MSDNGPSTTDMKELLREVQNESDGSGDAFGTDLESGSEENKDSEVEELQVSKSESNDISVLLDEGELLARQGSREEALAVFNRAIAIDPTCDMAWFNRGVILEGKGDTLGARQSFAISLDINENNGPAAANLSILLDRIGEVDEAANWANVALHTFPGHSILMDVISKAGMTPTKIEIKPENIPETPVEDAPEEKWNWSEKVVEKVAEKFEIEDQEKLVEAAKIHDDGNKYLNRSELELGAEDISASIEPIATVEDYDKIADTATEMLRGGDHGGALSLVSEHIDGGGKEHAGLWRVLAGCKGKSGDIDGAIKSYNNALSLDNSDSKSWHNLGVLHRKSGREEHALTCFQTAVKLDPDYLKAVENVRITALNIGNIEAAISAWERLLEINPQHDSKGEFVNLLIEIASGEAKILEMSADLPATIPEGPELAATALKYIGGGAENAELRARATSLSGDHVSAVAIWKEMLQIDESNPSYWSGLADSLEAAGDLETAIKCREKVRGFNEPPLQNDPVQEVAEIPQEMPVIQDTEEIVHNTELLMTPVEQTVDEKEIVSEPEISVDLSAAAADATQRVEASVGQYSMTSSAVDNDIEWYNRGLSLITEKKYREALSCLDRALSVFKNDDEMVIRILNARGNAFYFMEDYPKTIENYHQAMLINPSVVSGKTLYNMGTAYAEMERFDDAIKCYSQAIPRGLNDEEVALAREQTRRCEQLRKESLRRM